MDGRKCAWAKGMADEQRNLVLDWTGIGCELQCDLKGKMKKTAFLKPNYKCCNRANATPAFLSVLNLRCVCVLKWYPSCIFAAVTAFERQCLSLGLKRRRSCRFRRIYRKTQIGVRVLKEEQADIRNSFVCYILGFQKKHSRVWPCF